MAAAPPRPRAASLTVCGLFVGVGACVLVCVLPQGEEMHNVAEFWGLRPPIVLTLHDIAALELANVRARNPAAGLVPPPPGAVEPEVPAASPFGHGHSHSHGGGHGHSHG